MPLNNQFNVELGLKSKGFEKGLKDAGKSVDSFARDIGDYGSVIQEQKDITIEFEKELKRLQNQLANTSKGNLSQQKSLKTGINNLKVAIGDQRLALKDLNNQQKRNNVTSNSTINSLSRNYGAIQLLDQVTGGMASQFRAAEDATKLFNLQLKITKTAIIATGIGALVIALALMVAYWDDIVELITQTNAKLAAQNKLLEQSFKKNEAERDVLQKKRDLLVLQGKDTAEINRLILEKLALLKGENTLLIAATKAKIASATAVSVEAVWWKRILLFREGITKNTGSEKDRIAQKEKIKKLQEELALLEKIGVEIEISQFQEANPDAGKTKKDTKRKKEKGFLPALLEGLEKENAIYLFAEEQYQKSILALQKRTADSSVVIRQDATDEALNQLTQFQEDLNSLLSAETLAEGLSSIGEGIGEALGSGSNVLKAASQEILNVFAGFIGKLGKMLIKYGAIAVAKGTVDKAFATGIGSVAAGVAAIALGTALTAASSSFGNIAGGGDSGGGASVSAGGGTTTTFSGSGSGGDFNGRVVFEIAGDKLIGVLNNTSLGGLRVGDNELITTG
tara:strand:- start:8779 stop:10479 length:1701 start_codon:yes stop_codon:yes gene_type:complete